jgi:hypothetical protein
LYGLRQGGVFSSDVAAGIAEGGSSGAFWGEDL